MLSRRVLLGSAVAAPFVVRSGLLMPISTRLIALPRYSWVVHRDNGRTVLVYQDVQGRRMAITLKRGVYANWVLVTPPHVAA